jgi:AAA domain
MSDDDSMSLVDDAIRKAQERARAGQALQLKILSSAEFIKNFVPPDYLIEGLLQRQFFYSLTGKTGAGKTAIALLFSAFVALGKTVDGREFSQGRVLYLAGENPVDVQMRWIAMAQHLDFDADTIDVHFIPGVFKISEMENRICEEVEKLGGVALVVIDTSAAYFEGDNENDNTQHGNYARMQRSLVNLPAGPTVLVLCHPVKNAAEDNLLPRGGGAYLNEVDGNLVVSQAEGIIVRLHWQGKYRGQDFAPISFQLKCVTHERLKDSKGRQLITVLAAPLSDRAEKEIKAAASRHEDELLEALNSKGRGATMEELAKLLGWLTKNNHPNKTLVYRTAEHCATSSW